MYLPTSFYQCGCKQANKGKKVEKAQFAPLVPQKNAICRGVAFVEVKK